jgi:hypothetical protein
VRAQALGDAGETVAAQHLGGGEARGDALRQRQQAGGAAGDAQCVGTLAAHAGQPQRLVDGIVDALQVGIEALHADQLGNAAGPTPRPRPAWRRNSAQRELDPKPDRLQVTRVC